MPKQMNEQLSTVTSPIPKLVAVWGAMGVSLADAVLIAQLVAAILAGFCSLIVIGEWFYKKYWRDAFVRWGWMKPKKRRRDDDPDEEE